MKFLYTFLVIICILDIGIFSLIFAKHLKKTARIMTPQVLAVQNTPTVAPTDTPMPLVTPSNTPTPEIVLKKSSYSIAAFGDSMIDTMGENLEYLQTQLKGKYPKTTFHLYNYGIGGQNVSDGLARFEQPFSNRERHFQSISTLNSDIIIIGSFAYNPFSHHDRNRHYTELMDLVKKAQSASKSVYILSEIAPLSVGFGKGPGGVNWPEEISHPHALHIIEQLEDARNVANTLHVPLIDATIPSQSQGKFGTSDLVNTHDGIHPSVAGHIFTARIIANTLKLE